MTALFVLSAVLSLGVPQRLHESRRAISPQANNLQAWKNPCLSQPLNSTDFCNVSLPIDQRIEAIIPLLSPEDIVGLLANTASGVDHLSYPPYQWWSEALHGVGRSPGVTFDSKTPYATSFPQVILTSSSFNTTLFHSIGEVIGTEARAFNNLGHAGLTFWAPNINIFRDPRWGRGQETPGEDPQLTSDYAANFPRGLQDGPSFPKYLKVSSCCKHFAAYSLEDWGSVDRHHFNAVVTSQDLNDTYFPAFQTCVQKSQASGFMCSYNEVNGVPSCASSELLTDTLRNTWKFDGYVTSDCGAVADVMYTHKYTNNSDDTCYDTLTAGMDSDCGSFFTDDDALLNCIKDGRCGPDVTSPALRHLFRVQMRLGMFDPAEDQPYSKIGYDHVNTPYNQQLALDAARQGIVLLKNNQTLLPLSTADVHLALIGPHANATKAMQGNYQGTAPYLISPLNGVLKYVPGAVYEQGCNVSCPSDAGFAAAVNLAKSSTKTIVFLGLDQDQESEGHDRNDLNLPGLQPTLLQKLCEASSSPLVLVVLSGGAVDLTFARDNACVGAIIWAGYPGQSGGQALAEVIFGDVNPSGRLTQTFYPNDFVNQISMFDMNMRPNTTAGTPGRTYRFYQGPAVFKFGDGISYSTFQYKQTHEHSPIVLSVKNVNMLADSVHNDIAAELDPATSVYVTVCNTGDRDGDEVILPFLVPPTSLEGAPIQTLSSGHKRVFIPANSCKDTRIDISVRDLRFAQVDGTMMTAQGEWTLRIGQPTKLEFAITMAA